MLTERRLHQRRQPTHDDVRRWLKRSAWSVALSAALWGCERREEPLPEEPVSVVEPDYPARWIESDDGAVVAVSSDLPELAEAMAEAEANAQRTITDARRQFDATEPAHRDRWAIKWAAPIRRGDAAGGREQVWVIPLLWTEHRVEGILANAPLRSIGHDAGDLVGFPTAEIADWVRMLDAPATEGFEGRREGGFTIAVLERFAGPRPR